MQGAANVATIIKLYNADTWFLPLFLAAMIWLFFHSDRNGRKNIGLAAAAALILVFNDLAFKVISRVIESETYYRFLWMIPVVPLLAYTVMDVLIRQKSKLFKGIFVIAVCLLTVMGGTSCLDTDSFRSPGQVEYLEPEAGAVAQIVEADKDTEYPIVASDFNLVMSLRLYNSKIINYIDRNTYIYGDERELNTATKKRRYRMLRLVNGEKLKSSRIKKMIKKGKLNYIVIASEYDMDELMEESGCSVAGRTSRYTVYRCRQ